MFFPILLLIFGLVVLILGAEGLVRGASSISKKLGIPPIVIGLTIVAFGTSAPELIVNLFSALSGSTDLAMGNVIGSNISNILLVLGVSALFINLKVNKNTVWREIPFSFLAVLVIFFMTNDVFFDNVLFNILTRVEGLVLLGFFSIFMFYTATLLGKKEFVKEEEVPDVATYPTYLSILMTLGGLFGLFLGGRLLVDNAVILAKLFGMSEMLIGLTVVAVGTSLPELATSILAAMRKQSDIAIGNVIGSNIFNIFWILGLTSMVTPIPINQAANFDIVICLSATMLLFLALFIGKRHELQRWQGVVMILTYLFYIIYLIIRG